MKDITKGLKYIGQIRINDTFIGVYMGRSKKNFIHLMLAGDMCLLWNDRSSYFITDVSMFDNKRWYSYGDSIKEKYLSNIEPLDIINQISNKLIRHMTTSQKNRLGGM